MTMEDLLKYISTTLTANYDEVKEAEELGRLRQAERQAQAEARYVTVRARLLNESTGGAAIGCGQGIPLEN